MCQCIRCQWTPTRIENGESHGISFSMEFRINENGIIITIYVCEVRSESEVRCCHLTIAIHASRAHNILEQFVYWHVSNACWNFGLYEHIRCEWVSVWWCEWTMRLNGYTKWTDAQENVLSRSRCACIVSCIGCRLFVLRSHEFNLSSVCGKWAKTKQWHSTTITATANAQPSLTWKMININSCDVWLAPANILCGPRTLANLWNNMDFCACGGELNWWPERVMSGGDGSGGGVHATTTTTRQWTLAQIQWKRISVMLCVCVCVFMLGINIYSRAYALDGNGIELNADVEMCWEKNSQLRSKERRTNFRM